MSNIQTSIYDLFDTVLNNVDVFIKGTKSNAPCIIVEPPLSNGDRTLDNRTRNTHIIEIRVHTIHNTDAVNTKEANDIKEVVKSVMETPVITDKETYVGPPEERTQMYELEGQTAYDIILRYEIRLTRGEIENFYLPELLVSSWSFLLGSEAPTDIIKVNGSNESTYFNNNEFLLDDSMENKLITFDDNSLSIDGAPIVINLPDDFNTYNKGWKAFFISYNGERNIEYRGDTLFPYSSEVIAIPKHITSVIQIEDNSTSWVAVGNVLPKQDNF